MAAVDVFSAPFTPPACFGDPVLWQRFPEDYFFELNLRVVEVVDSLCFLCLDVCFAGMIDPFAAAVELLPEL